MDKAGKLVSGFVDTCHKQIKRFMALPIILKIFIGPLILVFSFTILLPIIAVAAVSYKGLKTIANIVNAFISIYGVRKNLLKFVKIILLFCLSSTISFSILMLVVILFFHLLPKFPAFVKWMVLAMSGYIMLLLYVLGKETNKEIKNVIKAQNEFDLNKAKNLIAEASTENTNRNPLVWLLSESNRLIFAGTFLLSGGIVVLLLFSATLNILIPGVFFRNISLSRHFVINWLIFLGQELLKVIPIEFLSPFLPKVKTFDIIRPWGNVLMIFIQTGITLLLYLSVFSIFGAYKVRIKLIKYLMNQFQIKIWILSKESCPVRPIPAYKAGLYGLTEDRQLSESNSKPPFIPVHRTGHSGNFSK